jgi:hypothetical protein
MSSVGTRRRIVRTANVQEFFRESLDAAIARQNLEADDHTVHYVVNLLVLYTRADELYDDLPPARRLPPLAGLFAAAAEARSERERYIALRRLGDLALFMAGFFPDALARKPVDVDYYIRMGGSAYGTLASTAPAGVRQRAFASVFEELAGKFGAFVEAIGEIADLGRRYTPRDILRLYERWLATGSERARQRLDQLGVQLSPAVASRASH